MSGLISIYSNDKNSYIKYSSCSMILTKCTSLVTAQNMKFSVTDFFSKCDQTAVADLVTFSEEIPNG